METNDLRFENTVTKLLEQAVICEISSPEDYRYLKDMHYYEQVDAYLYKLGRHLVTTQDNRGFYCAFNELNTSKKRASTLKVFESWVVDLEGVIEWLRLVRSVDKESRPLVAGTALNESELLSAIEESSAYLHQIERIAHKFKRGGKGVGARSKLSAVLQHLVDTGFLKSMGSTGTQFIATAKWSLLYDQLEFIRLYDNVSDDEDGGDDPKGEEQMGLL